MAPHRGSAPDHERASGSAPSQSPPWLWAEPQHITTKDDPARPSRESRTGSGGGFGATSACTGHRKPFPALTISDKYRSSAGNVVQRAHGPSTGSAAAARATGPSSDWVDRPS